ncbi:MAG: hypothetical protein ACYC9L_05445 [Sulfuricaulis sp.]
MARKTSTYEFKRAKGRYPWDEWLDGNIWELLKGEDFTSIESFRSSAQTQAKKMGGRVRTETDGDKLHLQFYTG